MIVYYCYIVLSYVGAVGCLCIVAFFLSAALLGHRIITPIASLVAEQERLEGEFRYSHVR